MPWLGPDATARFGPYLVRRATSADAEAYALADAQMVAETYGYTMPPEFTRDRLAEVPEQARRRRVQFDRDLDIERRGEEPSRRTWVTILGSGEIAGIAVSTSQRPDGEQWLDAAPAEGVTYQLNHLYLRPHAHGTGLGQALLDIALPDALPAYLWLVGGNDRAQRFYERNGFRLDPVTYDCGPTWFHRPLRRMWRR